MTDHMTQIHAEPVRDPQNLEPLLIARAKAGDIDGMVALYAFDAVIVIGDGQFVRGADEIRQYFVGLLAKGFVFHAGKQYPAVVHGRIALTSSRYPNGSESSEVARQQEDGGWLWIIDYPTLGA